MKQRINNWGKIILTFWFLFGGEPNRGLAVNPSAYPPQTTYPKPAMVGADPTGLIIGAIIIVVVIFVGVFFFRLAQSRQK